MDKLLRWMNSGLWLIGLIGLAMGLITGYQWWQQSKINDFVLDKVETTTSTHPNIRFHQAEQAAAAEDRQLARDIYTELGVDGSAQSRASAYYNRGNVNLNFALSLPDNHPKRLPLIELAKQDYRTALGFTAGAKDIQYNLALALRQIPEGPAELSQNPKLSPLSSDHQIEVVDFTSELP